MPKARKMMEERYQKAIERARSRLQELASQRNNLGREILEAHEEAWPPDMRRGGGNPDSDGLGAAAGIHQDT